MVRYQGLIIAKVCTAAVYKIAAALASAMGGGNMAATLRSKSVFATSVVLLVSQTSAGQIVAAVTGKMVMVTCGVLPPTKSYAFDSLVNGNPP